MVGAGWPWSTTGVSLTWFRHYATGSHRLWPGNRRHFRVGRAARHRTDDLDLTPMVVRARGLLSENRALRPYSVPVPRRLNCIEEVKK